MKLKQFEAKDSAITESVTINPDEQTLGNPIQINGNSLPNSKIIHLGSHGDVVSVMKMDGYYVISQQRKAGSKIHKHTVTLNAQQLKMAMKV